MTVYLMSLGAGLLVGVIYNLINVRSPAPPAVALIGLLGILLGEQMIAVGKQLITGTPLTMRGIDRNVRSTCSVSFQAASLSR